MPGDAGRSARGHPDSSGAAAGWQNVAALALMAIVLIAVVLVTRSAAAVSMTVPPLLLLLGWVRPPSTEAGRSSPPDGR